MTKSGTALCCNFPHTRRGGGGDGADGGGVDTGGPPIIQSSKDGASPCVCLAARSKKRQVNFRGHIKRMLLYRRGPEKEPVNEYDDHNHNTWARTQSGNGAVDMKLL